MESRKESRQQEILYLLPTLPNINLVGIKEILTGWCLRRFNPYDTTSDHSSCSESKTKRVFGFGADAKSLLLSRMVSDDADCSRHSCF